MRPVKVKIAALMLSVFGWTFVLFGCASKPDTQPAAEQQSTERRIAITGIETSPTADGSEVIITADQPVTFATSKQADPPAVVLLFPNTTVSGLLAEQITGNEMIPLILTQEGSNGNGTARVELRIAGDPAYAAKQEGNSVRLNFAKAAKVVAAAPSVSPTAVKSQPATTKPAASSGPAAAAGDSKGGSWVNKIDFLGEAEGKSTLAIGTTQPVDYRINKVEPKKLEIRLLNTRIPSYRQRPLITTRFISAVDRVVPYQAGKQINETIVAVDLREAVPYFTEQSGNLLLIHFEASGIPPKPLEQAQLPTWKQAMSVEQPETPATLVASSTPAPAATTVPATTAASTETALSPMPPAPKSEAVQDEDLIREEAEIRTMLAPRRTNFTGEKIALDFYETDVKNVFRILREVSGKNFAIDKDVTGKVTMTLDKPVPWDQVLDLVLRMNQLGMVKEGDIVRIATLETLKKEDDLRKAKLEALKKAREDAKELEPLVTRYFPVSYCNAKTDVAPHVEKILTEKRGAVTVDEKNNQVIVTDVAAKVRQAEQIIARIDKVTSQVIIEARVVEVTDNFSKELGINWNMSFGPGTIAGTGISVGPPGVSAGAGIFGPTMAMNLPSASTSSIGIAFSRLSGIPFVLNARLNALETTGKGRILSSPKILTLDNKKAKIKQGVEYPYLERDSSGGSSVKFKNIDLLLEVTPHVTPDNRVSLVIFITKNDVAGITAGVPSVATNEAQTELLVNDGDTVVIGGIIKRADSLGENAFPGLSKIPVLGWAFKNRTDKTQGNELLIFITPRIVQLEQSTAKLN
jgi:type IV pilus assembly protein PilQ